MKKLVFSIMLATVCQSTFAWQAHLAVWLFGRNSAVEQRRPVEQKKSSVGQSLFPWKMSLWNLLWGKKSSTEKQNSSIDGRATAQKFNKALTNPVAGQRQAELQATNEEIQWETFVNKNKNNPHYNEAVEASRTKCFVGFNVTVTQEKINFVEGQMQKLAKETSQQ